MNTPHRVEAEKWEEHNYWQFLREKLPQDEIHYLRAFIKSVLSQERERVVKIVEERETDLVNELMEQGEGNQTPQIVARIHECRNLLSTIKEEQWEYPIKQQ